MKWESMADEQIESKLRLFAMNIRLHLFDAVCAANVLKERAAKFTDAYLAQYFDLGFTLGELRLVMTYYPTQEQWRDRRLPELVNSAIRLDQQEKSRKAAEEADRRIMERAREAKEREVAEKANTASAPLNANPQQVKVAAPVASPRAGEAVTRRPDPQGSAERRSTPVSPAVSRERAPVTPSTTSNTGNGYPFRVPSSLQRESLRTPVPPITPSRRVEKQPDEVLQEIIAKLHSLPKDKRFTDRLMKVQAALFDLYRDSDVKSVQRMCRDRLGHKAAMA